MKFLPLALPLALPLLLTTAVARMGGINFDSRLNNKACREASHWTNALRAANNAGFHEIRLFGTSDCGQLDKAIQAALPLGIKIQVGVWLGASYDAEKKALIDALNKYSDHKWLHSVSVGSEELHRHEIDSPTLAAKITDVKGMLNGMGVQTMVGHVDATDGWLKKPAGVIYASDFIGANIYPFFGNVNIGQARDAFFQQIQDVKNTINSVSANKPFWITETGWPTAGNAEGAAIPSVQNSQKYYKDLACSNQVDGWYFMFNDPKTDIEQDFSIFNNQNQPVFDLNC